MGDFHRAYRYHSLGAQSDASSYGSVDKLLLKLAATYLTNAEFGLFETMIESLKDDKNGDQVKLFDSQAKSFNEANFQLGVARLVPSCGASSILGS